MSQAWPPSDREGFQLDGLFSVRFLNGPLPSCCWQSRRQENRMYEFFCPCNFQHAFRKRSVKRKGGKQRFHPVFRRNKLHAVLTLEESLVFKPCVFHETKPHKAVKCASSASARGALEELVRDIRHAFPVNSRIPDFLFIIVLAWHFLPEALAFFNRSPGQPPTRTGQSPLTPEASSTVAVSSSSTTSGLWSEGRTAREEERTQR